MPALIRYWRDVRMRMIDADKLIEEIESYRGDIFASEIVELIKQMTSVDDTKWIPCSEKFPDKSGTYIVSAFDGAITRVSFTKWMPRLRTWALSGCRSYWKVTAWMPLPEPYKKEGETS